MTTDTSRDPNWKLMWSDEFATDGAPNEKNWKFEQGFARNEEFQWYQKENATVKDGHLVIEARRETRPNPLYEAGSNEWRKKRPNIEYTSSSLQTAGLHAWQFGRFEIRARIKTKPGLWPAFWTLGVSGEWPSNGEIDIMEFYRGKLLANVAWGKKQRWQAHWDSVTKPVTDFNDPQWDEKFHIWRMDWDAKSIKLYVDDLLLNETDLSKTINDSDGKNPFHQPHYILVNLAVGGQNGGDPSQTEFPTRYEVDWVRIYQRTP